MPLAALRALPDRPCRNCPPSRVPSPCARRREATRLRDSAILALLRAGLSVREIQRLRANAVARTNGDARLRLQVNRSRGVATRVEIVVLEMAETHELFVYVEQSRSMGEDRPLFISRTGRPIDTRELTRIAQRARRAR